MLSPMLVPSFARGRVRVRAFIGPSSLEGLGQGALPPRENATLAVLSSGDARGVGDPGYTSTMSDGYQQNLGPVDYLEAHYQ